jgi:hypothetical protein
MAVEVRVICGGGRTRHPGSKKAADGGDREGGEEGRREGKETVKRKTRVALNIFLGEREREREGGRGTWRYKGPHSEKPYHRISLVQ